MLKQLGLVMAIGAVIWIAGCKKEHDDLGVVTASGATLPEGLVLSEAPANAREVKQVRQDATDGEEVIVHGRVGGRAEPFVDGRAVMMIVDTSVPTCNANPDDKCPTPWDYCCVPKDDLLASAATVQVMDAGGQPIKTSLHAVPGLKPLSEVVVKGKVQKSPDGKILVIHATGLWVKGT